MLVYPYLESVSRCYSCFSIQIKNLKSSNRNNKQFCHLNISNHFLKRKIHSHRITVMVHIKNSPGAVSLWVSRPATSSTVATLLTIEINYPGRQCGRAPVQSLKCCKTYSTACVLLSHDCLGLWTMSCNSLYATQPAMTEHHVLANHTNHDTC